MSEQKKLSELDFVDLYLGKDYAVLKGLKGSPNSTDPAPEYLKPVLEHLRGQCRFLVTTEKDPEFSIAHEGVMYRGTAMRDVSGTDIYTLRRSTAKVRAVNKIGIHPGVLLPLLDQNLKGPVLIAGETGAGKTSTAVAILRARLERLGGIAIAIEDPPEVPLNGPVGIGRCMQIRASRRTGGYKEHLTRSLRANPDMIFLGEVREEAAAREVVEASLNGHLIISTVHAGGVVATIERLASLASGNGPTAPTFNKLANGLQAVIWQALERDAGQVRFRYEALSLIGPDSMGARSKLQSGNIRGIAQDIEQQMLKLKNAPIRK